MIFSSLEFVLFFITVIAVILILKNKKYQHIFLLIASYFFFYFSSNYLIFLLFFSTILDFYLAKLIWIQKEIRIKKLLLVISILMNIGLLGFFKYADFAILKFNILGQIFNLNSNIPILELVLPIGISFYTFQTLSYTIDVYRGDLEPSKSLKEFALFVTFFPQLVAGPIIRAKEFLPQLREKLENNSIQKLRTITINESNLKLGTTIIVFGFIKKIFFADNISPLVNFIFQDPTGYDSLTIMLGTLAYGIQIYCDFSGYTDIAIGTALILGFKFSKNFNRPYLALSPSDFWRRWHISLSTWLRDYLYLPLGGNKKGGERTYFNLFAVMILGGLWHGASWNFIIWGILHGSYLAIPKFLSNRFPLLINNSFLKSKFGKIISLCITQYFIFLAWIPFRVQDPEFIIFSMKKFLFIDFNITTFLEILLQHKFPTLLTFSFIIIMIIGYKKQNLDELISKLPLKLWILYLTLGISITIFFFSKDVENFIYFRF